MKVLSRPMPSLDGLRGVAILLVLAYHLGFWWPTTTKMNTLWHRAFEPMWCGVDLFFVLSGFLITGILLDTKGATNYFGSFYARRALRIFPVFYLFLGLFSVVTTLEHRGFYWTHLSNWLPYAEQNKYLYHLWSLAVEEQFYLIWPFVVFRLSRRQMGSVAVALVVAAFATRLSLHGWPRYLWTPARLDTFALGALVALGLRDRQWHERLVRFWGPTAVVSGATFFGTMALTHQLAPTETVMSTVGMSAFAFGCAALLVGATIGPLQKPLGLGVLRSFGKYSYAIYIFHFPLMVRLAENPRLREMFGQHPWLGTLIGIGGSYVLGYASWTLFERHILALKARFAARVPAASRPLRTSVVN